MSENPEHIRAGHLTPYGAMPVPKVTPDLLSLVRNGNVYSLGVIYRANMPVFPGMLSYTLETIVHHGAQPEVAPVSGVVENVSMATHVGTHIDALSHIGEWQDAHGMIAGSGGQVRIHAGRGADQTIYASDSDSPDGQRHLSIAAMPPIIMRGILLDVAEYKGVEVLPSGYEITPEDIQETMVRQGGTEIRPGTAVLIRTGYYKYFEEGNSQAFGHDIAGIGLPAARYLFAQGMMLQGSDNLTVERVPPDDQPVHRFFLVHNGMTQLEVLYLDELAEKKAYEFLLIASPLRLQGASGSWVNPIAIT